ASIVAWATDPAISWRNRRWSNPIEALISSMMASGPVANRPPHILLLIAGDLYDRYASTPPGRDEPGPAVGHPGRSGIGGSYSGVGVARQCRAGKGMPRPAGSRRGHRHGGGGGTGGTQRHRRGARLCH